MFGVLVQNQVSVRCPLEPQINTATFSPNSRYTCSFRRYAVPVLEWENAGAQIRVRFPEPSPLPLSPHPDGPGGSTVLGEDRTRTTFTV